MEDNGVLKFEIERNDIQPKKQNARVSTGLVAHGDLAFWAMTNFTVNAPAAGTSTGSSTGTTTGSANGTFNGSDPFGVANLGASLTAAGGPWFVMTAEIPLLETELQPFLKALHGSDIIKPAIHNHDIQISPVLIYVHLEGVGNQPRIAILKKAIATTGIGQVRDEKQNSVAGLDQNQIQTILGGTASGSGDVLSVEIPRPEQFSSCLPAVIQSVYNRQMAGSPLGTGALNGVSADFQAAASCETTGLQNFTTSNGSTGSGGSGSSSGTGSGTGTGSGSGSGTTGTGVGNTVLPNQLLAYSEIEFQSDGNGKALVDGELAVLSTEIELTEASLISQGFDISAVHNHASSESPRLFFIHFSKRGNSLSIAKVIRAVMDQNQLTAGQISTVNNFQ
jgi:hypothetical protein